MHTITVIVPAHNEEEGLPATLESLARQTVRPDRILVVDDASTDRTGEVAASHGVTVLRPPHNLGSKARAQNYALPHCTTDLVLAVDADTVLAPDYIETVVPVFRDPAVSVAAGTVRTRHTRTLWERGRSTEYLFGFHWHRVWCNLRVQRAGLHLCSSEVVRSGLAHVHVSPPVTTSGGVHADSMLTFLTWRQFDLMGSHVIASRGMDEAADGLGCRTAA
ncbi:glycosyltransferase family 2 protein [Streptomyces lydicus]|uniref:glycosyltransferase family 2 protein n=1 Tax=Streptomyces lydicus TaxID=47763 RepID=UPI0036E716A9